jgi:hypothetical protein
LRARYHFAQVTLSEFLDREAAQRLSLLLAAFISGRAPGADRLHEPVSFCESGRQAQFRKTPQVYALTAAILHESQPPALGSARPNLKI